MDIEAIAQIAGLLKHLTEQQQIIMQKQQQILLSTSCIHLAMEARGFRPTADSAMFPSTFCQQASYQQANLANASPTGFLGLLHSPSQEPGLGLQGRCSTMFEARSTHSSGSEDGLAGGQRGSLQQNIMATDSVIGLRSAHQLAAELEANRQTDLNARIQNLSTMLATCQKLLGQNK
ncbi:hypothetical protein GUITHDRAFT_155077, partial [Guillardia theta CCMP2712]